MIENQQVKTRKKVSDTTPSVLRRSHWSARMKDLCEKNGGTKELCRLYCDVMTDENDPLLMRNRVNSILQQRSSVETASDFVITLENLINRKP